MNKYVRSYSVKLKDDVGRERVYREMEKRISGFPFPQWTKDVETDAHLLNKTVISLARISGPAAKIGDKSNPIDIPNLLRACIQLGPRVAAWFKSCPSSERFRRADVDSLGRLKPGGQKLNASWFEGYIEREVSEHRQALSFCSWFLDRKLVFKNSEGAKIAVWIN